MYSVVFINIHGRNESIVSYLVSRIQKPENLPPFENKLMADVTFSRNVFKHSKLMLLLPEDPK
jgi:transposase-like protein